MKGWIKLHRQIMSHPFYEEDRVFSKYEAWTHLMMMANHADNKTLIDGKMVVVERGSFITSVRKLQERWKWSNTKAISFLDMLESEGMIIKKSDTKKTVITLTAYEIYQGEDDEKRHPNDTETTQKHTNKNVKNLKNEKKERKELKDIGSPVVEPAPQSRFIKPTLEQVKEYCEERKNGVDAEKWFNHYTSNGWKVGRTTMKDWKAAVRTWERNTLPNAAGGENYAKPWRNARGHTEEDRRAAERDDDLPNIVRPSFTQMSEVQRQRIEDRIRST